MILTISDIIYINDAAKALKQKSFMFFNNRLYGMDNISSYVVYVDLDPSRLSDNFYNCGGPIFNAKDLSKFVKGLSIETDFFIDDTFNNSGLIVSKTSTLQYIISHVLVNDVIDKVSKINELNFIDSYDAEYVYNKLVSMKKADGSFAFIFKSHYYITIFPGLIPVNKGDKIILSVCDIDNGLFVTNFKVLKKKFTINIYVAYVKV